MTEGREREDINYQEREVTRDSPGSTSFPRVPIEILVEQHQILPVRVRGVARVSSMARPSTTLGRGDEERVDSAAELVADLEEVHLNPRPRRTLHLQIIAVEIVVALQSLNDQEVDCG